MSFFSCSMSKCPVTLPRMKQGTVPSNDITGIYFIYQMKRCPVDKQKFNLYYRNTDLILFYFDLKS